MRQAPPTDRGERSRRAILDVACRQFADRGYAGTSLNDIIAASGLTKGGFYFHFPSKQALALAVVADNQARWVDAALSEARQHPRAVDQLFETPRALVRFDARDRGLIAQQRLVNELSRDPELRDELCGTLRDQIKGTARQFRAAQAEGDIRPDVDPDLLAEVAIGGFLGMQTMTEQFGDGDLERRVEALIHVVQLASLTKTPTR